MVHTADNLSLICPYIRAEQVEDLLGRGGLQSLRVITLWDSRAFLAGASEPEALRRLLQLGGEVRTLKSGLHAKLYIADRTAALVTSANFTAGGLTNNLECGVALRNREAIDALVERFNHEWRRAAPLAEEHVAALLRRPRSRKGTREHRTPALEGIGTGTLSAPAGPAERLGAACRRDRYGAHAGASRLPAETITRARWLPVVAHAASRQRGRQLGEARAIGLREGGPLRHEIRRRRIPNTPAADRPTRGVVHHELTNPVWARQRNSVPRHTAPKP